MGYLLGLKAWLKIKAEDSVTVLLFEIVISGKI